MELYCYAVFTVDFDKLKKHTLILKETTIKNIYFFKGVTKNAIEKKNLNSRK